MIRYQYKNPEILFIGINPHPGTFKRGVPFSNNKMFWYLLQRAGLIDEEIADLKNDVTLKEIYAQKFNKVYKFGLINIIDRPTRNISYLKKGEETAGRNRINRIAKSQKPKVICFIGKITYQKYRGSNTTDFGWQEDIHESKVFVMHAPLRGKAEIRIDELKLIQTSLMSRSK